MLASVQTLPALWLSALGCELSRPVFMFRNRHKGCIFGRAQFSPFFLARLVQFRGSEEEL